MGEFRPIERNGIDRSARNSPAVALNHLFSTPIPRNGRDDNPQEQRYEDPSLQSAISSTPNIST